MKNDNIDALVDTLITVAAIGVVAKALEQPDVEAVSVNSTMIHNVEYINSLERLRVEFQNGALYEYQDVPRDQFDLLVTAESTGKYFNANIKDRFVALRLEEV